MDMTPSNTLTSDKDSQTPPPTKPNGTLKRHQPTTAPPPPQPPSTVVFYMECLKNHAATIGGHALDGCGEFMAASDSNPTDPRSLICAACGCHRNFHRLETHEHHPNPNPIPNPNPNFIRFYPSTSAPPLSHRGMSMSTTSQSQSQSPMSSPSPPPISHHFPPPYNLHHHTSAPHMLLALGNANSEEHHHHHCHCHHHKSLNSSVGAKGETSSGSKKRYRTKFTQEQKERMLEFAENLDWRILRGSEEAVAEFCNDVGVSRGVFKVWMHNNKNAAKKRLSEAENAAAPPADENIDNGDAGDGNGDGNGGVDNDANNAGNTNGGNNDINGN